MPFLSHGGISLRYEHNGAGLALVFVHGLLANHTFWERQVLLRSRFQVVRLDLRGHGDSSKPKGSYSTATFAEDVRHLVMALGIQRLVLVGWSMGGLVAQQALRLLNDRVAGLVLVGTTACATSHKGYPHGLSVDEQKNVLASAESDYKGFVRQLASRLFREEHSGLEQWAAQQMAKTPPYAGVAALQHAVLAADERRALATIKVPVLVCHGRHDKIFAFAGGEHIHKHVKGSRLVSFTESGHAPMIEEHERFNREIEAFAEGL